jgi:hypothetical protein
LLEDPELQSLQDHAIGPLSLSIRPWMSYSGPIHVNIVVVAESEKFLSRELRAIVVDDGNRDAEAINGVGEERRPQVGA